MIDPGKEYEFEVDQGDARYFKPLCEILTDQIIVQTHDITGSSRVFVSSKNKNPNAWSAEWSDVSDSKDKLLVVTRDKATGPLYIGVEGTSKMEISKVSIDVYNDLFPGVVTESIAVNDRVIKGTQLFTMPAPAVIDGLGTPALGYALAGRHPYVPPLTLPTPATQRRGGARVVLGARALCSNSAHQRFASVGC